MSNRVPTIRDINLDRLGCLRDCPFVTAMVVHGAAITKVLVIVVITVVVFGGGVMVLVRVGQVFL